MKAGFFFQTIIRIIRLLSTQQRRGGLWLMVGILVNGLLDVLGLAVILPVITVAMRPEIIQENHWLKTAYEKLGMEGSQQFLLVLVLLMLVMFIAKNLFGMIMIYLQARYSTNIATDLSRRKYLMYLQKGYQKVKNIDSGNYITNVRNIPTFFAQSILIPLASFISEIVVVTIILIGIAAYNFQLILVLGLVMGTGFMLIYRLTRKYAYRVGEQRKVVAPRLIALTNETIQGYVDIHIFQRGTFFLRKFLHEKIKENRLIKLQAFLSLLPSRLNELIAVMGIVLVFIYSIFLSGENHELLFLLSLFAAAAYRVMPSMNRMLASLVTIKSHLFTLEILEELHGVELDSSENSFAPLPFQERITIEHVSFQFDDSDTPTLRNISLEVKKGQQIGLIGSSGSGKTTLMSILLRMYKETSGHIAVDGTPINPKNEGSWLAHVGFVQQQVFVLDGTVLENVAFGQALEEIDEDQVILALKRASLWEFVQQMPQGIHTPMGEFGSKLSGGQRQRIAIARALYKQAEVFVFDEATSALDPTTEQMIIDSINILAKSGKTIFLIAHRFTTLQGCDRIFELDEGRIVREYGYDELLKDKLGLVQENNS